MEQINVQIILNPESNIKFSPTMFNQLINVAKFISVSGIIYSLKDLKRNSRLISECPPAQTTFYGRSYFGNGTYFFPKLFIFRSQ